VPVIRLLEINGHSTGPGSVCFGQISVDPDAPNGSGDPEDVNQGGNPGDVAAARAVVGLQVEQLPALFGEANVLTAQNAKQIGEILSQYLSDDALIVLNNCNTGLAKDPTQSIAAQLAAGSKRKVLATMGFVGGSVLSGNAKISQRYENLLSFYELRKLNEIIFQVNRLNLQGAYPQPEEHGHETRDGLLKFMADMTKWLKDNNHGDTVEKIDKYYNGLVQANYDSQDSTVRLYQ
jgi:hypothetical protein